MQYVNALHTRTYLRFSLQSERSSGSKTEKSAKTEVVIGIAESSTRPSDSQHFVHLIVEGKSPLRSSREQFPVEANKHDVCCESVNQTSLTRITPAFPLCREDTPLPRSRWAICEGEQKFILEDSSRGRSVSRYREPSCTPGQHRDRQSRIHWLDPKPVRRNIIDLRKLAMEQPNA